MVHARPIIVQKPSFTVIIQKPLLTMISLTCTIRPPHNFRSFQWTTWFPWKTLLEIFHERLLCPFFETVSLHVCFVSSVSSRHHTILTDSNTAPPPYPPFGSFPSSFRLCSCCCCCCWLRFCFWDAASDSVCEVFMRERRCAFRRRRWAVLQIRSTKRKQNTQRRKTTKDKTRQDKLRQDKPRNILFTTVAYVVLYEDDITRRTHSINPSDTKYILSYSLALLSHPMVGEAVNRLTKSTSQKAVRK